MTENVKQVLEHLGEFGGISKSPTLGILIMNL